MQSSLQALPVEPIDLLNTEQLKSAWLRGGEVEFGDPLLAQARFPFSETYFPLGFPVTVSSNCNEVLNCAAENWGGFTKLFDTEPVRIDVGVTSCDSSVCPPTPMNRFRNHLASCIADSENFAISDRSLGYSMVWVTTAAVRHRDYFRYFFLESCAMGGISGRYATPIHGACVSLGGEGILLCGDSGAGKTTLCYACARAGWTYVTDDGSYLVHGRNDRLVVGNCGQLRFRSTAEALFPELCGREIMERAGVGKPSIELSTRETAQIVTSSAATVQRIVFLKRNVRTQELAAFPTAVARLFMMQCVSCMAYAVQPHAEAIDHLLQVDAYELRYNDLNWAVKRLESLVLEGR